MVCLGEVVEIGPVDEISENPGHPYTEALLESVPRADTSERGREVATLAGDDDHRAACFRRVEDRAYLESPPLDVDEQAAANQSAIDSEEAAGD